MEHQVPTAEEDLTAVFEVACKLSGTKFRDQREKQAAVDAFILGYQTGVSHTKQRS